MKCTTTQQQPLSLITPHQRTNTTVGADQWTPSHSLTGRMFVCESILLPVSNCYLINFIYIFFHTRCVIVIYRYQMNENAVKHKSNFVAERYIFYNTLHVSAQIDYHQVLYINRGELGSVLNFILEVRS